MPEGLRTDPSPLADVLGDLCLQRLGIEQRIASDATTLDAAEDAVEDLHFRIKRAPVVTLSDARAMAALTSYLRARAGREADAATMQAWLVDKLNDGLRR
jgi:hypothetical protein